MLAINLGGKRVLSGNRHWPSSAILAERRLPLLSSSTVHVLLMNSGEGRQNKKNKARRILRSITIPFFVFKAGNMELFFFRAPVKN